MPIRGSLTLGDVVAKTDVLAVACSRCDRAGARLTARGVTTGGQRRLGEVVTEWETNERSARSHRRSKPRNGKAQAEGEGQSMVQACDAAR